MAQEVNLGVVHRRPGPLVALDSAYPPHIFTINSLLWVLLRIADRIFLMQVRVTAGGLTIGAFATGPSVFGALALSFFVAVCVLSSALALISSRASPSVLWPAVDISGTFAGTLSGEAPLERCALASPHLICSGR